MSRRPLRLRDPGSPGGAELRAGFAQIRNELELPEDFSAEVLAEANDARAPLPAYDVTQLPFLTIDPAGSMDLDQAMHIERRGTGYRVRYAIADVAAFVRPGGAIDAEARRRGQTLYSPDTRTPLHPPVLSEGAASLLPGQVRPALLWTIDLDSHGDQRAVEVQRAAVRSHERFDYIEVQSQLDAGTADECLQLLADVGRLREEQEVDRGGVSLPIPEQEIAEDNGSFRLGYRVPLPVEGWNAQISLLTGMAAADMMLHGEIGVLRTLPQAPENEIRKLRRASRVLGVDWPDDTSYAEVIRSLDPGDPRHAALLQEATTILRGAGYVAFEGGVPEQPTHAAVAAEYAHVTAPLRRLVDRYAGEVCLSLSAGIDVPEWVRRALAGLPQLMAEADRRAGALERECVNLMEAAVLRGRQGQVFDAVVIDVREKGGGIVQLSDPAVRAACDGALPLGEAVEVRLLDADLGTRRVQFELA